MKNILLLIILTASLECRADLFKSTLVSLNTIYVSRDYNDNGVQSSLKETDTDFRLTRIEKNWAYGVVYALSSNDSSQASRTSYGLSLGYFSEKDFYMSLNYFLASKYNLGFGSEYSKGSGYEIDLGFLSKVTSSFYVGLALAIKTFSYSEQVTGGVATSVSATHKDVLPMFTFAVNFM
jgi:hypothetical protein